MSPGRILVVGVTASGKSRLAHEVAVETGAEIATVDSMTVYREMDIGTAKPSPLERREVAYHLVDLVDPADEFTVAQFQRAAREVEASARERGRVLVHVGGTGLYGRAVVDDLEIPGQYLELRAQLEEEAARSGLAGLHARLEELDPVAASRMDPTNARRVLRALEVTIGSGRPFSSYGPGLVEYAATNSVQVGLRVDLEVADRAVESRFRRWMDEGLLEEVERLARRPRGMSRTARQAVGYRELLRHVEDGLDLDSAVSDAIAATRRLVRRQRRWFERDPRIEWFDSASAATRRLRELVAAAADAVGD